MRFAKNAVLVGCIACVLILWLCRGRKAAEVPARAANLGPIERGFVTVFGVPSAIVEPDLSRHADFRTSQLALFNGKVYASRRVLYRSFASPRFVIVLALDVTDRVESLQSVLEERRNYCNRHGYGLYARYVQDFAAENKPAWEALGLAPMRLLRQAMLAFPTAQWFWMLNAANGEIRGTDVPMEQRLAENLPAAMLSELALRLRIDASGTVQNDAVTLTNFASDFERVSCILSYDAHQTLLSSDSIIVRQSLTARTLLETLVDPIIQEHEPFRKTHDHAGAALTHLARWHPLLVQSIALVTPEMLGTGPCDDKGEHFACLSQKTRHALSHKM